MNRCNACRETPNSNAAAGIEKSASFRASNERPGVQRAYRCFGRCGGHGGNFCSRLSRPHLVSGQRFDTSPAAQFRISRRPSICTELDVRFTFIGIDGNFLPEERKLPRYRNLTKTPRTGPGSSGLSPWSRCSSRHRASRRSRNAGGRSRQRPQQRRRPARP